MATNDPRPVLVKAPAISPVITKSPLSVDDAELFASRIRPSWELVDDSMRSDLAADFGVEAAPAGAPREAAPDTIIEGVPTLAVGVEAAAEPAPAAEAAHDEPKPAAPAGMAKLAPTVIDEGPQAPKPTVVDEPAPPEDAAEAAPAEPAPAPAAKPAPAGKTKVGLGAEANEAPVAEAPAPARQVAAAAPAPVSPSRSGEDEIELPMTGAPKGLFLKIGLAAAAVIGLVVVGIGVLGGKGPPPAPTATTQAATPPPPKTDSLAPPVTEPAATQAPAAETAAPTATAATATAAATAAAVAAPTASAKAKAAVVDSHPAPEVKKAAAVVAPVPDKAKPVVPAKKGGGIIRDSPF